MVKVYGPMMSLDASGTLAKAVTFSKWKGRNYVRERVIPANPKSGGQVGRRAMFKFLTQAWAANSAGRQATWQDLADQLIASRFNAFVSTNMARWHNELTPGMEIPIAEKNATSAMVLSAAAWEQNRIKLSFDAVPILWDWGVLIFAKLGAAVTGAVGNTIIVDPRGSADGYNIFWTPPEVGTWHFDARIFSNDGGQGADTGPVSAAPP